MSIKRLKMVEFNRKLQNIQKVNKFCDFRYISDLFQSISNFWNKAEQILIEMVATS